MVFFFKGQPAPPEPSKEDFRDGGFKSRKVFTGPQYAYWNRLEWKDLDSKIKKKRSFASSISYKKKKKKKKIFNLNFNNNIPIIFSIIFIIITYERTENQK